MAAGAEFFPVWLGAHDLGVALGRGEGDSVGRIVFATNQGMIGDGREVIIVLGEVASGPKDGAGDEEEEGQDGGDVEENSAHGRWTGCA